MILGFFSLSPGIPNKLTHDFSNEETCHKIDLQCSM